MPDNARRGPVRFGVFELDPASGELLKRGVRLRLRDKPLQVLLALVERPGEIVTRQVLQQRLWPDGTFVEFENGLNNAMSRLRDVLGDAADTPRYIETVPRRGYRFIAPLETEAAEAARSAGDHSAGEQAAIAGPGGRRAVTWRLVAVALALSATLLATLWLVRRDASPAARSLAVLPFVAGDAVAGSMDEYLAFGMTDALIGELSRIGSLSVISQTSVLRYRGARKTVPEIARELNVGTIVEGSVVREGGTVRVTVQLIDARTDTHLWSQAYSHAPDAAIAGQRQLAREVAGIIRTRLVPGDRTVTPDVRATSAAAYEAYLKGRYFLKQMDEAALSRARGFFEQAIAADPGFAPAHVGLSNYFTATDAVEPGEAMRHARASAVRALELDDESASAHAALAFVHYFGDWDWAAAERAFARAIALDPGDATARRWHALYLSAMGRHATAAEEVQRAIELDPVSISAFDAAGAVWSNARRFDLVLEQARRIAELAPGDPRGFLHFAVGYLHHGRFADAIASLEKGMDAVGRAPAFLCVLAVAQHRAGRTDDALRTLAEIDQLAAKGYVPEVFLAVAYLWLRDHDAAIARLERAFEERDPYLVVAKVAPWFDPVRSDRRFQALMQRMNFPP
jgi:TolB-like protein/DNA-binding winged helix-turn-helix (wHTH) protein/Tfp pilus assembly protein PilF